MVNWFIKNIKNQNSNLDFRLKSKRNSYSKVNFKYHDIFRVLVSLSYYLTNGIILAPDQNDKLNFYQIEGNIFDFKIKNFNKTPNKYLSLSKNMKSILFYDNKNIITINRLTEPNTKVFSNIFLTKTLKNLDKYMQKQKKYGYFLVTGFCNNNNLILDLVEKENLIRYQIENHNFKLENGYQLFLFNFDKLDYQLMNNFVISYDEYLSYIYDLMLPYKYDFNQIGNNKFPEIRYSNSDIERIAFAIDPNGSKDRDDAIAAFYYQGNKIVNNLEDATHIKLLVHISNTLDYIQPTDDNYYYHYSKYKSNTDYLDKSNLPMMDRILSEDILSLEGNNKSAITISILYRIAQDHTNLNRKFIIDRFPERIEYFKSNNLNVIGTTYHNFAESFNKQKENRYDNSNFIERLIIPCNKNIIRDFTHFIQEGSSKYKDSLEKQIANNLKQLYIMMVNSLDHTGKDSLLKIPSGLVRDNNNIYLDFDPVDMWAHSLVEYTALEANIYFAYLTFMISKYNVKNLIVDNKYIITKADLIKASQEIGSKNQKLIIDQVTKNKEIRIKKIGFFRNLYNTNSKKQKEYLNSKSSQMINRYYQKNKKKNYFEIVDKILSFYKFDNYDTSYFLRLMLSLRQMLLLKGSKTNLDITTKLISKDIKMKAEYDYQPIAHLDICTYLYTHSTSPMRRFVDINVHNLIFNLRSRNYVFKNVNLNNLNAGVDDGKSIFLLVNQQRFIDFIKVNKNPNLKIEIIDKKFKTIGLIDLVNFYSFNSLFNLNKKDKTAIFKLDKFLLPAIEKSSSKDKTFNVFFHMLRKNRYSKDIQKYLEIIFKVKKVNNIC